ncbi:hypothetical protein [Brevibacillus brevis]|uniref:Uncharacterized protein n=1 Tax=Brevibacillus brevis TaxID=1393 RepID=A0A517IDP8_BREBE|nr:hypothetical protein [Brevibacillus brevis]QDS37002.1 hypothetical protein FPS98_25320 [Brevibacillus brevis]
MSNPFSYSEYSQIIHCIKKQHNIIDYSEVNVDTKRFAVIRHDVEFSVERAYNLAKLENTLQINTSYMFQIRNNAYNLFSNENIRMVREINGMGHKIGLHVHLGMLDSLAEINQYIVHDSKVMESFLQIPIDRFSFHRPPKELLKMNVKLEGLINSYEDRFFEFREEEDGFESLQIKYISDSRHTWNYGYPDEKTIKADSKIQFLFHPYSWTEYGYENSLNFQSLKDEKVTIFTNTVKTECNHFSEPSQ